MTYLRKRFVAMMKRAVSLSFRATLVPFFLWTIVLAGCASQNEMFVLDDRLAALEQRHEAADRERAQLRAVLDGVTTTNQSEEQTLREQSATLRVDMDTLREEVRRLSGQVEEALHALREKTRVLEDLDRRKQQAYADLNNAVQSHSDQLQRIETYLNFEKQEKTAPEAAAAPAPEAATTDKKVPEDQLYEAAKAAFDNGDIEAARQGFNDLIKRFPNSAHSDNAQFWIGESYYREKWYEKAILEYQKVIENYPKGNKVQASLLKQGFAFLNLGDTANARLILKELVRRFPKSNEAAIAQNKLSGLQ